jgi:hypothetical protein
VHLTKGRSPRSTRPNGLTEQSVAAIAIVIAIQVERIAPHDLDRGPRRRVVRAVTAPPGAVIVADPVHQAGAPSHDVVRIAVATSASPASSSTTATTGWILRNCRRKCVDGLARVEVLDGPDGVNLVPAMLVSRTQVPNTLMCSPATGTGRRWPGTISTTKDPY